MGRSKGGPSLLDGVAVAPFVIIYKRYSAVSSAERLDGQFVYEPSLDRQDDDCRMVIATHNLKGEVHDISDSAITGTIFTRPGLIKLVKLMKERPGSALVVEDCDRILRDDDVWHTLAPIIKHTKTAVYDKTGGPLSHMLMNIKMVLASENRRILLGRSYSGKKLAVLKGCMLGPPMLGYRWAGRGAHEKCPIEAPIVLEIGELFGREGMFARDIVAKLREEGKTRRSGKEITRQDITSVLNSPLVLGWSRTHFKK